METDRPFWIASITKMFIAVAVLKLQEAGRLSIDDPVAAHLPEEWLQGVHVVQGVDYGNRLTLRHLLSHASGLPDYLELKGNDGRTLVDRVVAGDQDPWKIDSVLKIVKDAGKPLFEPRTSGSRRYKIRYSDTNYQLLVAVVEAVTGQGIGQVFQEEIFEPLALGHTFHPGDHPLQPTKTAATVWNGSEPFQPEPRVMRSFGDLNSTLSDLTAFMRALIQGRVFQQEETLHLMMGNWKTLSFALSPITPSWPIAYGMGMMRFEIPRLMTPFKPVPPLMGHTGAVGSWLFYCREVQMIYTGTVSQVMGAPAPFKVVPCMVREAVGRKQGVTGQ